MLTRLAGEPTMIWDIAKWIGIRSRIIRKWLLPNVTIGNDSAACRGAFSMGLKKYIMRKAFRVMPRDQTLLDLPCGTGRFSEVLLEEGFKVVGIDISQTMLEVAKRKLERFGPRFETRVADVRELAKK